MGNNQIQRYKLYKAGKLWLTSMIVLSGALLLQTTSVSANEATATQPAVSTIAGPSTTTAQLDLKTGQDTTVSKQSTDTSSSKTAVFNNQHALDLASNFHIFSKQVQINADCNGNIAAGEYISGNEFGTRGESYNNTDHDLYYLGKIDNIGSNGFRGKNKVVFGNDVNFEIKGNQVFINGVRQDHLDAKDVLDSTDAIDFDDEFGELKNLAGTLANYKMTSGVKTDFKDMNRQTVDLSGVDPQVKRIFVDIDAKYLSAAQPLTITGLSSSSDGPMVILNVINAGSTLDWQTQTKLVYDNNQSIAPSEAHNYPNHIIWNFGTDVEKINITSGYLMGSILAPSAELKTTVNADGNLIAKKVTIGGESHRWDLHLVPDSSSNDNGIGPVTPHSDDDDFDDPSEEKKDNNKEKPANSTDSKQQSNNNGSTTPSKPTNSDSHKENGNSNENQKPGQPDNNSFSAIPDNGDKSNHASTPSKNTDHVTPDQPKSTKPTEANKPTTPVSDQKTTQPDQSDPKESPATPENQPQKPSEQPSEPKASDPDPITPADPVAPAPAAPVDPASTGNLPDQTSKPAAVTAENVVVKTKNDDVVPAADGLKPAASQAANEKAAAGLPQTGSGSALLTSLLGLISLSLAFLLPKFKQQ